ncbi:MAG: DNA-primase RepB domain-containing protein [Candidatus Latescibacterota bacterium]
MGTHAVGSEPARAKKASDHTEAMLTGWKALGVDRADLAVRLPDGEMCWQRNRALEDLPLAWPRAMNAHTAEVYIRPARGFEWPVVFLDDVATSLALEAVGRHGGLAVRTSPAGGCHLWLPCSRPLDEEGRHKVQRWLAGRFGADPASVSGEHLGRLAGFRNWKRGGCWVNLLRFLMDPDIALVIPQEILEPEQPSSCCWVKPTSPADPYTRSGRDTSPSGMDWRWVCTMLEAGKDPEQIRRDLVVMARSRRGEDAERYARRTVGSAMRKVGRKVR